MVVFLVLALYSVKKYMMRLYFLEKRLVIIKCYKSQGILNNFQPI